MKKNYRMVLCYDGTRYDGWAKQKNTDKTIQGKLEAILTRMTDREVEVIGCGRTDAGVHADHYIANAFLDTGLAPEDIKAYINQYLPEDIAIIDVVRAGDRFHSRYNAIGKTYQYTCYLGEAKPVFDRNYVYIPEGKLDVEAMRAAAALLTGTHDYASFCGNAKMKKSTVRTVDRIDISQEGDYLRLTYHGNGFLQYMVRILTGTLLEVGYGQRTPDSMIALLAAKKRAKAGATAPAKGLRLVKVDYD